MGRVDETDADEEDVTGCDVPMGTLRGGRDLERSVRSTAEDEPCSGRLVNPCIPRGCRPDGPALGLGGAAGTTGERSGDDDGNTPRFGVDWSRAPRALTGVDANGPTTTPWVDGPAITESDGVDIGPEDTRTEGDVE